MTLIESLINLRILERKGVISLSRTSWVRRSNSSFHSHHKDRLCLRWLWYSFVIVLLTENWKWKHISRSWICGFSKTEYLDPSYPFHFTTGVRAKGVGTRGGGTIARFGLTKESTQSVTFSVSLQCTWVLQICVGNFQLSLVYFQILSAILKRLASSKGERLC